MDSSPIHQILPVSQAANHGVIIDSFSLCNLKPRSSHICPYLCHHSNLNIDTSQLDCCNSCLTSLPPPFGPYPVSSTEQSALSKCDLQQDQLLAHKVPLASYFSHRVKPQVLTKPSRPCMVRLSLTLMF
jgi:hypothetical protein